jgi:predicted acyltransferase
VADFTTATLLLAGVIIFQVASVLTGLLDGHFSTRSPYLLQAAALLGFLQLFVLSYLYAYEGGLYLATSAAYLIAACLLFGRSVTIVRRKRVFTYWD